MRITHKNLRKIIREELRILESGRAAATPDEMKKALMQGKSARSGEPFLIIALEAIENGDPVGAANAVMNALWIDDPWPEDEQALEMMMAEISPDYDVEEQIFAAAAKWLTQFRAFLAP